MRTAQMDASARQLWAASTSNANWKPRGGARPLGRVGPSDPLSSPRNRCNRMSRAGTKKEERKRLGRERPMAVICGVSSMMQGAVHLVLFAAFLFLALVPSASSRTPQCRSAAVAARLQARQRCASGFSFGGLRYAPPGIRKAASALATRMTPAPPRPFRGNGAPGPGANAEPISPPRNRGVALSARRIHSNSGLHAANPWAVQPPSNGILYETESSPRRCRPGKRVHVGQRVDRGDGQRSPARPKQSGVQPLRSAAGLAAAIRSSAASTTTTRNSSACRPTRVSTSPAVKPLSMPPTARFPR